MSLPEAAHNPPADAQFLQTNLVIRRSLSCKPRPWTSMQRPVTARQTSRSRSDTDMTGETRTWALRCIGSMPFTLRLFCSQVLFLAQLDICDYSSSHMSLHTISSLLSAATRMSHSACVGAQTMTSSVPQHPLRVRLLGAFSTSDLLGQTLLIRYHAESSPIARESGKSLSPI